MKLVNPEINRITLYKSPEFVLREKIREIICDKHGLEVEADSRKEAEELVSVMDDEEIIEKSMEHSKMVIWDTKKV